MDNLAKELLLTIFQLKVWSNFFPEDTPFMIEQRLSEELLLDAKSAEDIIRLTFERMSNEFIEAMKKENILDKDGNIIKK